MWRSLFAPGRDPLDRFRHAAKNSARMIQATVAGSVSQWLAMCERSADSPSRSCTMTLAVLCQGLFGIAPSVTTPLIWCATIGLLWYGARRRVRAQQSGQDSHPPGPVARLLLRRRASGGRPGGRTCAVDASRKWGS